MNGLLGTACWQNRCLLRSSASLSKSGSGPTAEAQANGRACGQPRASGQSHPLFDPDSDSDFGPDIPTSGRSGRFGLRRPQAVSAVELLAARPKRDQGRALHTFPNSQTPGVDYFRSGLGTTLAGELDYWIRQRRRAYVWKQWKLPRTRVRNLMVRGVSRRRAVAVGNTR